MTKWFGATSRIILNCPTPTLPSVLARQKRSLRIMPPLHLGLLCGTNGTRNPLPWFWPRHRRPHPFLSLSRRHLRRPWTRHPVHPVVVVFFLSPTTHPAIASIIQTLVPIWGGQERGRNTTNTPITRTPLHGGEPPKNRRNLVSPSGRPCIRARNAPPSLQVFAGKHQSPHEKCFHLSRETFVHTFSSYGHVYSFSSEGCTRCTPNHGTPASHPYQMPMVQNSYTKAVGNSDMLPPHLNGQLENYDEWVEKLQQWFGGCDPTYRKAN